MYLLDSQVPLKPGEKHCLLCEGYGAFPPNRENPRESETYKRCWRCNGTGKEQ